MTPGFVFFVSTLTVLQCILPKRFAFLPLVIGACHLGNVEITAELTTSRLLIGIGVLRAVLTGGLRFSFSHPLDRVFIFFSVAAILSSAGHSYNPFNPWIARAGLVYNVFGSYLYGRAYLPDKAALERLALVLPIILMPLATCLILEKGAQRNYYAYLGSGSFVPMERDGKIRAQGPFRHAILAGCAGATVLPFALFHWYRRRRLYALATAGTCMSIVLACASSGPLAAVFVSLLALVLWRWRRHMRLFLYAGLAFAAFYWIVAGRGPWYIMASIDLVGGSTGWHRAKLFDQGFKYLGDWWLYGTDYTRHWMATGVSWSPDHVDLTNYYLHLGVMGGILLPGLVLFGICWSLYRLFKAMEVLRLSDSGDEYLLWCLGAIVCTHAVSFVSISYFDQMYVFFYLSLAVVPGILKPIASSEGGVGGEKIGEGVAVGAA